MAFQKHHFVIFFFFLCGACTFSLCSCNLANVLYKHSLCLQTCKHTALKHLRLKSCTSVGEPVDAFFFGLRSSDSSEIFALPPPCIYHASKLHRGQRWSPACVICLSLDVARFPLHKRSVSLSHRASVR